MVVASGVERNETYPGVALYRSEQIPLYGPFLDRDRTLSFNGLNTSGDSTRGVLSTPEHCMQALIWMRRAMYCTPRKVE